MKITCPECHTQFPLAAGVAEDDGKRLAMLFGELEPVLARAVIGYLRLFKPPKTALRTARAVKVVEELLDLVRPGTVCRDERTGLRRPATAAMWAAGIEQMLALPGKLTLPLANHNYLRAIVWGLADQADAQQERTHEAGLRKARPRDAAPVETKLQNELAWLRHQLELGAMDAAEHDTRAAAARERWKGGEDE